MFEQFFRQFGGKSSEQKMSNEQQDAQNEQVDANEAQVETQATEQDTQADVEVLSPEQAEIETLKKQLAAAQTKVADQQDSVIRAKAEVDNIRRRSAQDVEKAHKFALEKFAGELLSVADNLGRALEVADREDESLKPMIEGIELTLKSFDDALSKQGITEVNPEGETFNPELHQAMSMVPNPDVKPNTVIAVMQKGYQINGRLLRPAMVMVSASAGVDTQA